MWASSTDSSAAHPPPVTPILPQATQFQEANSTPATAGRRRRQLRCPAAALSSPQRGGVRAPAPFSQAGPAKAPGRSPRQVASSCTQVPSWALLLVPPALLLGESSPVDWSSQLNRLPEAPRENPAAGLAPTLLVFLPARGERSPKTAPSAQAPPAARQHQGSSPSFLPSHLAFQLSLSGCPRSPAFLPRRIPSPARSKEGV